jgi:alkylresorcinol/alkylpyrone synthase
MAYLLGSHVVFPEHHYDQDELLDALIGLWGDALYNPQRLRSFFANVQVDGRYLALAKERYAEVREFGARNRAFREVALDLLERLVPTLLERSGFALTDIGTMVSTTVTGLAVPTLEARLMNRLPFSTRVKRVPLFGLGCLAGAAGVARLHDLLHDTDEVGLLLAVELCSLTLQTKDVSVANLVATGLFGDGAAGVVMAGTGHAKARQLVGQGRGCKVVATRSAFFSESEDVMGWEFDGDGFQIVLNNQVPQYAAGVVSHALAEFLQDHKLKPSDIRHWVAHPGGPKVMGALEDGLGLPGVLDRSRRSLEQVGNLSSVSVLTILDEVLSSGEPELGDWGVLMAMGPAFCAEFVLLKWEI